MATEIQTQKKEVTIKSFFAQENVKAKFTELLGKKSTGFLTSLLSVIQNNGYLQKAKPESVYMSAMMAAALDLPINPNLGFAYIIPYGDQAQFQMGYKGFIQLALRSGQFKTIASCPVYEGQLISENPLTGYVFDFAKKTSDKVIGYAAYFSLINGFEKTDYKTVAEINSHGAKFSKTFASQNGVWKKDFDAMAMKTVLKLLLAKYAPLSVDMQKAVVADQAIIIDAETLDVDYKDEGVVMIELDDLAKLYESKKAKMKISDRRDAERIIGENESESFQKLKNQLEKIA